MTTRKQKLKAAVKQITKDDMFCGYWENESDFIFNTIGCMVGFGNALDFPFYCYSFGGGAFFIPYLLCLLLVGIPMVTFEFMIGQLSGGRMHSWMFCPFFGGIELITTSISFLAFIPYIIKMVWVFYYFCMSFKSPIPWKNCHKEWATFNCADNLVDINTGNCTGVIISYDNGTCYNRISGEFKGIFNRTLAKAHGIHAVLPAEDYLKYAALRFGNSAGLHDIGSVHWPFTICLAMLWIFVLFVQLQGVRFYRKIPYFAMGIPFVFMTALLIQTFTLKGSGAGIFHYLYPNASYILKGSVWNNAVIQVFFTLSSATNGLVIIARRNRFHFNLVRGAFLTAFIDTLVSFVCGLIVFGFLGSYAYRLNVGIRDVISSGSTVLLVVLPQALASLTSGAKISNMAFFLSLLMMAFCSQLILFETVVSTTGDYFLLNHRARKYLSISICGLSFLLGTFMTRDGGVYVYKIFNDYSASWNAVLASFLMTIAIIVYGPKKFCIEIQRMVGSKPLLWIPWKYMKWYYIATWTVITPIFLLIILVTLLASYEPSSYGDYVIPPWGNAIGWFLSILSIASFFADFIKRLLKKKGNVKEVRDIK